MTIEQAIEILRKYNEWRRGAEDIQPSAFRVQVQEGNKVITDDITSLQYRNGRYVIPEDKIIARYVCDKLFVLSEVRSLPSKTNKE